MEGLMIDCVQSSLRQLMHRNAIFICERLCAEFPTELTTVAPPPLYRNGQQNLNSLGGESSPKSTVNATIQAPRRKFVDEGKLRKVSGRLFPDSGPRRSARLNMEASANTSNSSQVGGNGASHTSKYLGGGTSSSRLSSRSVTVRKGQSWATESLDEGKRFDAFGDSRSENSATMSSPSPSGDDRYLERERTCVHTAGVMKSSSKIITGASELLSLLRTLGED